MFQAYNVPSSNATTPWPFPSTSHPRLPPTPWSNTLWYILKFKFCGLGLRVLIMLASGLYTYGYLPLYHRQAQRPCAMLLSYLQTSCFPPSFHFCFYLNVCSNVSTSTFTASLVIFWTLIVAIHKWVCIAHQCSFIYFVLSSSHLPIPHCLCPKFIRKE